MSEQRKGLVAAISAYFLWGLAPLYWPLLLPASALEVLAHRIVWSVVVVGLLLFVRRKWKWIRQLTWQKWLALGVAALLITVNWGVYIFAVQAGHVVDASIGYFVNPLFSVFLGLIFLGERLNPWQWVAVGLAGIALVVLFVGVGAAPWVALVLGGSFAVYGLLKKKVNLGTIEGLSMETAVLFMPALGFLIYLGVGGQANFGNHGWGHAVLLAASGLVTAIPLLLFGSAATRVPLATLGFTQYLAPTMMLLIGVLFQDEVVAPAKWVALSLIWSALLVLSLGTWRNYRRNRDQAQAQVRQEASAMVQPDDRPKFLISPKPAADPVARK